MNRRTASKPVKSILDPAFRYRPSHATDLRATFERVRRELEQLPNINVVRLPIKEAR
jgi:hypothetical protein